MIAAKKARRRPRRRAERLPGQPPGPGGHTGFAVRGCSCWLCAKHRVCERREAATRALEDRNDVWVHGSVRFAANATAELRERLNGGVDR